MQRCWLSLRSGDSLLRLLLLTTGGSGARRLPLSSPFIFQIASSSTSPAPSISPSAAASSGVVADVAAAAAFPSSSNYPKADSIPTLLQPRVVVYDGLCRVCHDGVKWVINADKYHKIKFCCLQSKAADPYLIFAGLDREDVRRQLLFVEGPDSYYQGSTATLKVLSYLPLPYQALSAFLIIPTPVRDMFYGYDARRHYKQFKEEKDCIVMHEKDILDRFIDRDEILAKENIRARHL